MPHRTMNLKANQFERTDPGTGVVNPDGKQFVAEASELGLPRRAAPYGITLSGCPEEGMHRSFCLSKVDKSGEDTMGWRYDEMGGPNKNSDTPFTILIIND